MEAKLVNRRQELHDVWSFFFTKPDGWNHDAGDYTELALAQDGFSGRRWFTIASAPHEQQLQLTVKYPPKPSQFKQHLLAINSSDSVYLSPAIGNFNLPLQPDKLLFVAAGIGITPYRSMILDIGQNRLNHDVTLVYTAKTGQHIFGDIVSNVKKTFMHEPEQERLTVAGVKELVPDWSERIIYLAGPELMMAAMHEEFLLSQPRHRLKLEYFPGHLEL